MTTAEIAEARDKQKQIALLLGWKPEVGCQTVIEGVLCLRDPRDGIVRKPPPWPTDDGTAIKALEEWCDKHDWMFLVERATGSDGVKTYNVRLSPEDLSQDFYGYNQSLARAIVEAMIAAHKSMEGTKHE